LGKIECVKDIVVELEAREEDKARIYLVQHDTR